MRYQGNDALNRFFKFLQIGLFIYQGAASGNWNPARIQTDLENEDPFGLRASQHGTYAFLRNLATDRWLISIQRMLCRAGSPSLLPLPPRDSCSPYNTSSVSLPPNRCEASSSILLADDMQRHHSGS